jgi:hypothetical protein
VRSCGGLPSAEVGQLLPPGRPAGSRPAVQWAVPVELAGAARTVGLYLSLVQIAELLQFAFPSAAEVLNPSVFRQNYPVISDLQITAERERELGGVWFGNFRVLFDHSASKSR